MDPGVRAVALTLKPDTEGVVTTNVEQLREDIFLGRPMPIAVERQPNGELFIVRGLLNYQHLARLEVKLGLGGMCVGLLPYKPERDHAKEILDDWIAQVSAMYFLIPDSKSHFVELVMRANHKVGRPADAPEVAESLGVSKRTAYRALAGSRK